MRDCGKTAGVGLGGILYSACSPTILTGRRGKPNIVFIIADTQKYDRLGFNGYSPTTATGKKESPSPYLDRIAEKGVVFDLTYSQSSFTLVSIASMLTSTYPRNGLPLGTEWKKPLDEFENLPEPNRFNELIVELTGSRKLYEFLESINPSRAPSKYTDGVTLPEALEKAGYETIAAVSMPLLDEARGFTRGFSRFSLGCGSPTFKRRGDITVTELLKIAGEKERDKPLFTMLHLYDVHTPYDAPPEYKMMFTSENHANDMYVGPIDDMAGKSVKELSAEYDGQVRFQDKNIENFLESLRNSGLFSFDRDLLVFCSDHGEDIGTHGITCGHVTLYRTVTHVPLLICGAGLPRGKRIGSLSANTDIAPTVADLAGIKKPNIWEGTSLSGLIYGSEQNIHDVVFSDSPDFRTTSVKTADFSYTQRFPLPPTTVPEAKSGFSPTGEVDFPAEQPGALTFKWPDTIGESDEGDVFTHLSLSCIRNPMEPLRVSSTHDFRYRGINSIDGKGSIARGNGLMQTTVGSFGYEFSEEYWNADVVWGNRYEWRVRVYRSEREQEETLLDSGPLCFKPKPTQNFIELFAFKDDPGETKNLVHDKKYKHVAANLKKVAEEYGNKKLETKFGFNEEDVQGLKALGYLQ